MSAPMEALLATVQEAVEDTPYVVDVVEDGFDLRLDLANRRWQTVLGKAGIERTVIHEVRPRGDAITITDVVRQVDWIAGAPGLSASKSVQRGRVIAIGAEKAWGLDEHGLPIKVADFSFAPQEGRELVTLAAKQLGVRVARSASETIGLAFFLFTVIGAAVSLVVVLVLWLLGVIPPS